ncbi:MAG: HEAT repeat domain-containing protein [Candidatus Zixiibacteriota bacterium]|nr:MAG: HEAT repeat domain-containing protein [candidate division Zixibacteria bacterium]
MKKAIVIILLLSSTALAQSEGDSLYQVIDSLFKFATTKTIYYQDYVQPSKEALGEIGEPAVPYLVDKMDTQDARTMWALVDIFKIIGTPAVPSIVEAIGAKDNYKRRLAVRALGDMKDTAAVEGLLEYADDPDFRIRSGVLTALGKIGNIRGVEPSLKGLKDDDYLVRTSAAVSLSMLADSSTVDPLLKALSDDYYGVRFKAAEALWNIGRPAVKQVKEALESHSDTTAYYLLIEIAGNLKDKKLIKLLEKILESDDPIARGFAVEALSTIDSKKAAGIFKKKLKEENYPFVLGKIEEASKE